MKYLLNIIVLIIILTSCANNSENDGSIDSSAEKWLIDSMKANGYSLMKMDNLPEGISDSVLRGYTDRKNGVFYRKNLKLKSLKITATGFKKKKSQWTDIVCFFRMEFENRVEEKNFESFMHYLLNFQTHCKNQVEFFKKDSVWYLRFVPMP